VPTSGHTGIPCRTAPLGNFSGEKCHNIASMHTLLRHNLRWLGWVQVVAIFAMATASGAYCQCQNGSRYASICKMPHSIAVQASVPPPPSSTARCSHCPQPSVSIPKASPRGPSVCSCTTAYCVLQIADQPASILWDRTYVTPPIALLVPLPAIVAHFEAPTFAVCAPPRYFPQRFLRPHSGRAPPKLP
jgi:hypothetical protein